MEAASKNHIAKAAMTEGLADGWVTKPKMALPPVFIKY